MSLSAEQQDKVQSFMAIAACDLEFAASFLEANGWSLEAAVTNFMEPGSAPQAPPSMPSMPAPIDPALGGGMDFDALAAMDEEPRAPIAQFRDTLIDQDPARARGPPPATSAANHPLEAFRNFRREGAGDEAGGGEASEKEVFGLPKRPRSLAEMYAAPTEICFSGTFDELRAAGRKQQKWLLINIQSPTEFASQQLNADTWRDETLRTVMNASFLFWQQYYDSPDGGQYCRFYLPNAPAGVPHIAVVDPITGASVKTWTGFKDAERLMDKLMEYADEPPCDMLAMAASAIDAPAQQLSPPRRAPAADGSMPAHFAQPDAGGGGGGAGDTAEEAVLAAAIAASLEPNGPGASSAGAAAPPEPAGPSDAEIDALWGAAEEPPADGVTLKIRLLDGKEMVRKFALQTQTLRDVLAAIHFSGHRLDPNKAYKLAERFGPQVTEMGATLQAAGVQRGVYNLSEC